MHSLIFDILVCAIAAFAGGFTQGLSGLGFGMITVGIFTWILNVTNSTILILSISIVMAISMVWRYRKELIVRDLTWILVGGIPTRVLAFLVNVRFGDLNWMKLTLGIFLLALIIYSKFAGKYTERVHLGMIGGMVIGAIGGLIGGLFGIGGTIFAIYFLWRYKDTRNYAAAMQSVFLILNLESLILFGASGEFNSNLLSIAWVAVLCAFVGMYFGLRLFDRISKHHIKGIVQGLITINAVWIILSNV